MSLKYFSVPLSNQLNIYLTLFNEVNIRYLPLYINFSKHAEKYTNAKICVFTKFSINDCINVNRFVKLFYVNIKFQKQANPKVASVPYILD